MATELLRCGRTVMSGVVLSLLLLFHPLGSYAQTSNPGSQVPSPDSVNRVSPAPAPRVEIFSGYSYLPELDAVRRRVGGGAHGFALAVDLNVGRRFGIRADFDAHFWTVNPRQIGDRVYYGEDISLYYYSLGPRFVQRWPRVSVFGDVLLEGQNSTFSDYYVDVAGGTGGRPNAPCLIERRPSGVFPCVAEGSRGGAFGLGFGGGVDTRATERLAIRVLQINYSLGGFGQGPGRKLRLKTGVVFNLGSITPRAVQHVVGPGGRLKPGR